MSRDLGKMTPEHRSLASRKGGCDCITCGRHDQIYAYRITGPMMTTLVIMAANTPAGGGWINIPDLYMRLGLTGSSNSRNHHKLAYWGLVEKRKTVSTDRNPNSAKWRVTLLGLDFLHNEVSLPTRILVHGGVALGPVDGDIPIYARQVLYKGFNFDETVREYWPNMNR